MKKQFGSFKVIDEDENQTYIEIDMFQYVAIMKQTNMNDETIVTALNIKVLRRLYYWIQLVLEDYDERMEDSK